LPIYSDLQPEQALFPAVLCSGLPPKLWDFCGEGDAAR